MAAPDPLAPALARWRLADPILVAETPRSFIYRVGRPDGAKAALKLLKPEAEGDEARGGELLAWYGGEGAAAVYGITGDAVLMQWLDGGSLGDLARSSGDAEASAVLAEVAQKLHAARRAPRPPLAPLGSRFAALFEVDPILWGPDAAPIVAEARQIARELLDSQAPAVPLHGDLHHDNILRGPSGWVAIDPKGLVGDPAYDYANSFQNPERAELLVLDAGRVARHAAILAARSGIDSRRLIGWAVAHCALSGAWHVEDGNSPRHQLRMLALLLPLYRAAGHTRAPA